MTDQRHQQNHRPHHRRGGDVGRHHDRLAVPAVGEDSGQGRKDHVGDVPDGLDDGGLQGRLGLRPDDPHDGEVEEGVAEVGDGLAGPEEYEGGVAEQAAVAFSYAEYFFPDGDDVDVLLVRPRGAYRYADSSTASKTASASLNAAASSALQAPNRSSNEDPMVFVVPSPPSMPVPLRSVLSTASFSVVPSRSASRSSRELNSSSISLTVSCFTSPHVAFGVNLIRHVDTLDVARAQVKGDPVACFVRRGPESTGSPSGGSPGLSDHIKGMELALGMVEVDPSPDPSLGLGTTLLGRPVLFLGIHRGPAKRP